MIAGLLFEHVAPRWTIALALALALAAVIGVWHRTGKGDLASILFLGLRTTFLLLLGWCLLRPLEKHVRVELLQPRFAVVLDTSASMNLAPREDLPRRIDTARRFLSLPWLDRLAAQCRIEAYTFSTEVSAPTDVDTIRTRPAEGSATRLRESLEKIVERYRGQKLAGVVLLTDGLDTREPGAMWARRTWPCPIYATRLEPVVEWATVPDVRVDTVVTPRRVTVGWSSDLKAVISGDHTAGRWLTVRMARNGESVQELPTQIPGESGSREVVFRLDHPQSGAFTYEVSVVPLEGETHTNDNRLAVEVLVLEAGRTVLYLEGLPRWESKYLNRALQTLPNLSAMTLLRGPEGRLLAFGTAQPSALELTEAWLARFQVIIVGDLPFHALGESRAETLRRFVEQGGSLVLLGGPEAWGPQGFRAGPLAPLIGARQVGDTPPMEGRYVVTLTPEGRAHPLFAADPGLDPRLPPVLSVFPARDLVPGAVVLAEVQTETGPLPLLVTLRYGQGKALSVFTDSLWRWQLEPESGQAYLRFWSQALQWLFPTETPTEAYQLELLSETDRLFLGESLTLHARLSTGNRTLAEDVSVTCELMLPDGRQLPFPMRRQPLEAAPGGRYARYAVELRPEQPGLYRAKAAATPEGHPLESPPFSFFVKPYTPESVPQPANIELLRSLASASGGRFAETNELALWLSEQRFESPQEERVTFRSRWQTLPVLACLIGLLCVEWISRKAAQRA